MKQALKNNTLKIEILINSKDYCLCFDYKTKDYSLNYLVNLEYKGKPPQLGMPIIHFLDKKIAKKLKDLIVFTELEDL